MGAIDVSARNLVIATLGVFFMLAPTGFVDAKDVAAPEAAPADKTFFSEAVLQLLQKHCYECHSHTGDSVEGGLVLDSRSGWAKGGDSGPALVPGKADQSLLMKAVEFEDIDLQMPPDGKLQPAEIEVFRRWIERGAYDPRTSIPVASRNDDPKTSATDWWSLQPVAVVEPPDVPNKISIRNDIDCFIIDRLSREGFDQNEAADRYALLRRATFDLIGLPPTVKEIDDFINDERADAWERTIDRLLKSPHYGERWGRHWLDVARYGDSNGGDINYAHANAWRYRDYVIRAFNDDKPYDTFICEQLAGDLLPRESEERRRELLTATGFLMLGPKMLAEVDTDKLLIDIVDEQLDVTGLAFLGMTFGCARCHDHKFDPVSTQDYYALAGIFRSTKVIDVLRPQNGVSEWLELDVTPAATRTVIAERNKQKSLIENRLAALGSGPKVKPPGSNDAHSAVLATGLPTLTSTTWSAWVRIHQKQVLGAVVSANYDGADQGHSLGFDSGTIPRVVWNHGRQSHTIIAAPKPVTFGEWHHLSVTMDAERGLLKLFVNGESVATASDVKSSAFSVVSVGRREASRQWQFAGDIDEVVVFDRALTDEQIHSLYLKQLPAVSPVLCWTFDKLRGNEIIDATGQHNGRLIGLAPETSLTPDGVEGAALSITKGGSSPEPYDAEIAELNRQLQKIEQQTPAITSVMAVAADVPVELPIYIRGSHTHPGETPIARRTPTVFDSCLPPVSVPADDNGRLQLANWIAHPDNPLTARVMVNRIWQHHFGQGLVRSASNFGTRGEQPSHPELLDWLAREFVRSGWSIKHMHRLMMNSATYRASSHTNPDSRQNDPDNRLLARYPVRRLEAEVIRDSLLTASGELDRTPPGSLLNLPNKQRVRISPNDDRYNAFCRAVYLPVIRVRSYEMFSIFDVPDNGQHVSKRADTLVAQQALFLMNHPFVSARAQVLAELPGQLASSSGERIDWLSRRLYGRPATTRESDLLLVAQQQLSQQRESDGIATWREMIHTMLCSNEFLFVR
jgi:hypothetical protein